VWLFARLDFLFAFRFSILTISSKKQNGEPLIRLAVHFKVRMSREKFSRALL
jgi:hypothetical protein